MSEIRGSGRDCQIAMAQELPRGATPRPRSAGAAERRYPASEVRGSDERSYPASEVKCGGGEEIPLVPSSRPGVAARRSNPTPPRLRPGAAAGRTNPTSKEPWLREIGRAHV